MTANPISRILRTRDMLFTPDTRFKLTQGPSYTRKHLARPVPPC